MKKYSTSLLAVALLFGSCSDDDSQVDVELQAPAAYEFSRNGGSTVNYSGQTTRIMMAGEILAALKDNTVTLEELNAMIAHVQGDQDFAHADLNSSDKNVYSKIAASADYFAANTTLSNAIRADFNGWVSGQVNEVFANWEQAAATGTPGFIQQAGGGSLRYVNAKGLEYNQAFAKGLLGALMADQMLNNYLSPAVLDEGANKQDNDGGILESGKPYTSMEHKWDEAFGYLYGMEPDASMPVLDVDSFLSEYLERVDADADFAGIADDIYEAFVLGRHAITQKDYALRDAQAGIIRGLISKVIAVRAVYYLDAGKKAMSQGDMASAFHALSEAYGFIYSLQFTRQPGTNSPYFSNAEVNIYLDTLMNGNGFWDVDAQTLDEVAAGIASRFDFTVEQAL